MKSNTAQSKDLPLENKPSWPVHITYNIMFNSRLVAFNFSQTERKKERKKTFEYVTLEP